jgi:signal peptidase I
MTTTHDTGSRSPWISIWLSPRQTIDYILATEPRRFVWLLAALGTIASIYSQMLTFGFLEGMAGWRVWLCCLAGGTVIGILFLYLNALILRGVGSLIGGRASTLELRAVLAWSAVPAILGLVIAVLLNAATKFFAASTMSSAGFSLLPLIIVVMAGLWSFVAVLLMLSRVERFGFWRTIAAYAVVMIFPFLIALAIRALLFHPYSLPSGSMYPTMFVGDSIFVSKYAYGYSRHSFPAAPPLFAGRIFGADPARGEVVAFRSPKDGMTDYVKRVVGLPGDRIQMKQGRLYLNDVAVKRDRVEDFVGDACGTDASAKVKRWRETLPNGATYETLDCIERGFYDDTNVYTVPSGHFFMLGDNRDNSTDSRVLSAIGFIPYENLIGRVEMVYVSKAPGHNGAAATVRSERVGLMVR